MTTPRLFDVTVVILGLVGLFLVADSLLTERRLQALEAQARTLHTPCFVYAHPLPGVVYPLGNALHCDPSIPMRMTTATVTP